MQENNDRKEIRRGIQRYKVGDPILFIDSADAFFTKSKDQIPIIHNNMNGKIVDFSPLEAGKITERRKTFWKQNIKRNIKCYCRTGKISNNILKSK